MSEDRPTYAEEAAAARVLRLWRSYESQVLPAAAGAVQRQETRRAFYAGAQALLSAIAGALEPGTEPTADDLSIMDGIDAELRAFADAVRAGRA